MTLSCVVWHIASHAIPFEAVVHIGAENGKVEYRLAVKELHFSVVHSFGRWQFLGSRSSREQNQSPCLVLVAIQSFFPLCFAPSACLSFPVFEVHIFYSTLLSHLHQWHSPKPALLVLSVTRALGREPLRRGSIASKMQTVSNQCKLYTLHFKIGTLLNRSSENGLL